MLFALWFAVDNPRDTFAFVGMIHRIVDPPGARYHRVYIEIDIPGNYYFWDGIGDEWYAVVCPD